MCATLYWFTRGAGRTGGGGVFRQSNRDASLCAQVDGQNVLVENTGFALEAVEFKSLGELKQPGGKVVSTWSAEGDVDAESIKSNLFPMELPPKSGRTQEFPEVDRAGWFEVAEAREKLLVGQRKFLDRLEKLVG